MSRDREKARPTWLALNETAFLASVSSVKASLPSVLYLLSIEPSYAQLSLFHLLLIPVVAVDSATNHPDLKFDERCVLALPNLSALEAGLLD